MPERRAQDFRDLQVWQRAHALMLSVYRSTADFPREEIYGLTSQLRRAALSIPANLAEGCGRGSQQELARFAEIARGSAGELEYLLMAARDLGYLPRSDATPLIESTDHVERMLSRLKYRLLSQDESEYET